MMRGTIIISSIEIFGYLNLNLTVNFLCVFVELGCICSEYNRFNRAFPQKAGSVQQHSLVSLYKTEVRKLVGKISCNLSCVSFWLLGNFVKYKFSK